MTKTRIPRPYMPPFRAEAELRPDWLEFLLFKREFSRRTARRRVIGSDTEVRAMANQGSILSEIAAHYGQSKGNMGNYCRAWGIFCAGMRGWHHPPLPPTTDRMGTSVELEIYLAIQERVGAQMRGIAFLKPIELPESLLPAYTRLAAYDFTVWRTLQKTGVEDLPPPPGAAADAQTAGLEED